MRFFRRCECSRHRSCQWKHAVKPPIHHSFDSRRTRDLDSCEAECISFRVFECLARLAGWAFGEAVAARVLLIGMEGAPRLAIGAWLVVWTIAGGDALNTWVWMLGGEEVLQLRADALVVKRHLWGSGGRRSMIYGV